MIKELLTKNNPLLFKRSLSLNSYDFNTPTLDNLITDMRDTMQQNNGVGLSAVQIGVLKRIAIIEYSLTGDHSVYEEESCSFTVIINPQIEIIGSELTQHNEGCLSVPNVRSVISRPKSIRYSYFDQNGNLVKGQSNNFFARVLQHEIDHMNGILFSMLAEI